MKRLFSMGFALFLPLCLGVKTYAEQPHADQTVRITFVGDICFDGSPGHTVTNGDDPFAAVADVLKDTDLAVGNLECTIANRGTRSSNRHTHGGPVECLPAIKKYFSAVTVANNHSGDWGKEGFVNELELLERERLPYFGGGRSIEQARRPVVFVSHGRRIAFLGYCNFRPESYAADAKTPGTAWLIEENVMADIKLARTRDKADIVIPFLHWGVEHAPLPEDYQVKLARKMIDAGADAVIGAHPHVAQTVDWYRGKPVIYSLGNFVFRYFAYDPPVYYGWIVRLTFTPHGVKEMKTTVVKLNETGLPVRVDPRD